VWVCSSPILATPTLSPFPSHRLFRPRSARHSGTLERCKARWVLRGTFSYRASISTKVSPPSSSRPPFARCSPSLLRTTGQFTNSMSATLSSVASSRKQFAASYYGFH
jgi:hypothetical protein